MCTDHRVKGLAHTASPGRGLGEPGKARSKQQTQEGMEKALIESESLQVSVFHIKMEPELLP